jgi:hypothetical protein
VTGAPQWVKCPTKALIGLNSMGGARKNAAKGTNRTNCARRVAARCPGGVLARGRGAPDGPGGPGASRGCGHRTQHWDAAGVSPHAHCAACMVERWSGRDTKFKGPGIRTGDRMWVGRLERSASRWWFVGEPADAWRGENFRAKVRTGARAPFESGVLASFSRRLGRGGRPYGVYAPGSAQVTRMHEFDNAK